MITQVDFMSENSFFVPVHGAKPKDSLHIRKIAGLDPPDPTLFIGEYSRDGGTYQGRRVAPRNVVITMDMNPNPALGETVSGLRAMLHKAFMEPLVYSDHMQVIFHDEYGRERYLVGYVEKYEDDLFDSDTMVQISLICPDPFIRDLQPSLFQNLSGGWVVVPFDYLGTARTGFEVTINIVDATSVLTLDNNGYTMVIERNFVPGDQIKLVTTRGSRQITLNGTESIVAALTPESPWLELHSQSNSMKIYGATTLDLVANISELRYIQAYWGM